MIVGKNIDYVIISYKKEKVELKFKNLIIKPKFNK